MQLAVTMSVVLRSAALLVAVLMCGCGTARLPGAFTASGAQRNVVGGQASPRAVAQEFIVTLERGDAAGNCRLWHTTSYEGCVRSETRTFGREQFRAGRDLRLRAVKQTGGQVGSFTIETRQLRAGKIRRISFGLLLRRYGGRWQEAPLAGDDR